jgi:hypothetical protein
MRTNFSTKVPESFSIMRGAWDTALADMLVKEDAFGEASKTKVASMMRALGETEFNQAAGFPFPADAPERLAAVAQGFAQVGTAVGEVIPAVDYLGQVWERSFTMMGKMGSTPAEAIEQVNLAIAEGTSAQELYANLLQQRFNLVQELASEEGMTWAEINARLKELDLTAVQHTGNIHNMWQQSFLFFCAAMMVNSAIQQYAATLDQRANPALIQFGRVMQEISSGAMIGMMSGAGVTGMIVGAVAGAVLGLGIAATTASPEIVELNKELATLAKKDDAIQALAKLGQVTSEQAELAKKAAGSNLDYAKQLETLAKQAESSYGPMNVLGTMFKSWISPLQNIGDALAADKEAIERLLPGFDSAMPKIAATAAAYAQFMLEVSSRGPIQAAADAQKTYNDILEEIKKVSDDAAAGQAGLHDALLTIPPAAKEAESALADVLKTEEDLARTNVNQKYEFSDSVKQANLQSLNSTRDYTQESAKLLRTLAEEGANLGFQQSQQTEQQARDRLTIERNLINSIADAEREFADRQADISTSYVDKLADLNYSTTTKISGYWHDLARDQESYQENLYKASRSLQDTLSDQSYSKAQELAKAKTQAEVDSINEKYAHEIYVANRTYAEKKEDAADTLGDAETETNYRIALANEELVHSMEVAQREADEQIAQARRSDNERVADAKRRNDEEVSDWLFKIAQQDEANTHQAALIQQKYNDASADAKTRWQNEESDIIHRFQLEHNALLIASDEYSAYATGVINWNKLISASAATPASQGWTSNPFVGVTGMAQGGETTVTRPTLFLAGESGTEHVKVTPLGQESGYPITIDLHGSNIYGIDDLEYQIKRAVRAGVDNYNAGRH